MPSATFLGLDSAKRRRIERSLLREFSTHPLAEAQVARIVSAAGIARGAFYVYFDDLADAYRHTLYGALGEIHGGLVDALERHPDDSLQAFFDYTSATVRQMDDSPYRDLFRLHWQVNESHLACRADAARSPADAAVDDQPGDFLAGRPLVVDGRPVRDAERNSAVVGLLMQMSHQCVSDALIGQPVETVLSRFSTLLGILRDGLTKKAEADVPRH